MKFGTPECPGYYWYRDSPKFGWSIVQIAFGKASELYVVEWQEYLEDIDPVEWYGPIPSPPYRA